MKIPTSHAAPIVSVQTAPQPSTTQTTSGIGQTFDKVMNSLKQGTDLHATLEKIGSKIGGAKGVAPEMLIQYQVAMSRYQLKIELVSKVAESASATVKKLQNQ